MDLERGVCGEIYTKTEKKRKLRDALEAHCRSKKLGSKKLAHNKIKKMKVQIENANIEEEEDISINDLESQESRIVELLECEETLCNLKQLHVNAKSKLCKYVSSGK